MAAVSMGLLYASEEPLANVEEAEHLMQEIAEQDAVQSTKWREVERELDRAIAMNKEVCGWLYVPNTNVSVPIVYEREEGTCGTLNSAGEDSWLGSVYMQSCNYPDFGDPVTVLYGHSFSDVDLMLTDLHKFESPQFFGSFDAFYIVTPQRVFAYRPIEAVRYPSSHIMTLVNINDEESVQNYIDTICDTDPQRFVGLKRPTKTLHAQEDKIVQLSTCTLPATKDYRFVVSGYLIGEYSR